MFDGSKFDWGSPTGIVIMVLGVLGIIFILWVVFVIIMLATNCGPNPCP